MPDNISWVGAVAVMISSNPIFNMYATKISLRSGIFEE